MLFTVSLCADSKKYVENGIVTQMRADWILPEDKRLEVTLKELNNPSHVGVSVPIQNS